jgi:Glycosyltransferase family 87
VGHVCCRAVTVAAGTVRLSPVMRRVLLGVIVVAAAYGTLALLRGLIPLDSTLMEKDFGQEYLLARAILDRVDPYQPIRDLGARYVGVTGYFDKPYPTPHPPTVGLLALPYGLLSYASAVRAWFGFELLCLVAAVVLLIRGAGLPILRRYAPLLAVALVAWPPVYLELGLGQLMLPLLLGLAGANVALLGGRSRLGGGLLGLTLLIKPIAWPWLIVLVWRRNSRAMVAALIVVVAGGVLSVVAIGVEAAANYLTHVLPTMSSAFLNEPTNMSLWTVAPRLGSISLSGLVPAAALVATAWWSCQRRPLGVSLAMMTIASLLVSPITWDFYYLLALLPVTQVMSAIWRRGLRRAETAAALSVFGLMIVSQDGLIRLADAGLGAGVLLEPAAAVVLLGILLAWLTSARRLEGSVALE